MTRPAQNDLLHSAYLAQADHLLKRMAIVAGGGIVVGIALYVALGLGVGI